MTPDKVFETLRSLDMRNERRIFWSEVAIIIVIVLLVTAYLIALHAISPGTLPAPPP